MCSRICMIWIALIVHPRVLMLFASGDIVMSPSLHFLRCSSGFSPPCGHCIEQPIEFFTQLALFGRSARDVGDNVGVFR